MMVDKFVIDGYTQLVRQLRKVAPAAEKELKKELRSIARTVRSDAAARASWSTRIPQSLAVSVTNRGAGVRIRRKVAPHGSLYELGSRKGSGRVVRHPLFGNWHRWYQTPTRPFIAPAVKANYPRLMRESETALRRAVRQAGF